MVDYRRTRVEALVVRNNHLLMVKDVGPDDKPIWRLPAAELEEGETPEDGMERALITETGLEGKVLDFIHRVKPKEDRYRLKLTYLCELLPDQGSLDPKDQQRGADAPEFDWRSLRNPELRESLGEILYKARL